jgi:hypothetical protein|tara:strand:+ start:298 stop:522 length:225 start_codon:yes stop_codon:yes gene_type:complete
MKNKGIIMSKMTWNYAACTCEEGVELVESYSTEGYTHSPYFAAGTREELVKWLRQAADDVEKNDVIICEEIEDE